MLEQLIAFMWLGLKGVGVLLLLPVLLVLAPFALLYKMFEDVVG